ncbi:hypothetical protein K432DRAFT_313868 [Lepidopterella palustris CBS 459.81]|uniref:NACHT-NTPase and P-loop NTPases N-terminal domain-containing protein n=1 Tax=Lepidopterella palustris CBS 459.81 TaxID=1314670 RepID=A0A8E2DWN0_9PEZI|nr:hypothetical protein K432DRAFT_313868 [Lepidopterella palustris CBS 459.81]
MVVPFGVSVGDFIAGIKLVQDLVDGLKESCSSSSDFRDLVRELHSLERALISVKNVIDPKNPESLPYDIAHVDALKHIVLQAKQTVDEFLDKNRKFLLSLGVVGGNGSGVRDWVRRVEWRRYKREDVQALRWKINGHSTAVNIILLSMQL